MPYPARSTRKRLEYALVVLAIIGVVIASTAFMSRHLAERAADGTSCDAPATC